MKVLLTGATGYIGHELAIKLANNNIMVHALVRNLKSNSIPLHKNIRVFKGDICDYNSILLAIKGCDYVFHTAAFTDLRSANVKMFYRVNVEGTDNLLNAASKFNIKKFIYTSTLSVYGPSLRGIPIVETQPRLKSYINDYELTKDLSERNVMDYEKKELPVIILNVSRVYGPGISTFSNGVNSLIENIAKKRYMIVPSKLRVEANYVYIDDVINAHINAMESTVSGEKFIIGGTNLTYECLFRRIKFLTKSKIVFLKFDYKLIRAASSILKTITNMFGMKTILSPGLLDSLFTNRPSTSTKAQSLLNHEATPFNIGLLRTLTHLKL